MSDRPPPIGPTLFTLFEMKARVEVLRARLADPGTTNAELLAALEEANRWTLAVETLLAETELRRLPTGLRGSPDPNDSLDADGSDD